MEWVDIALAIIGTGGIGYLIVEKLFARRQDKAVAKATEIQSASDAARLYNEIDEIVRSKTAPIEAKLDKALEEMETIKRRWCCYRQECTDRMLYQTEKENERTIPTPAELQDNKHGMRRAEGAYDEE